MNTSTNINQVHTATKGSTRTTASGFRRRCMVGALLVTTLTGTAVGFASMAHADDVPPPPAPAAIAPALIAPWIPTIDQYTAPWRVHCGSTGWLGSFGCSYG